MRASARLREIKQRALGRAVPRTSRARQDPTLVHPLFDSVLAHFPGLIWVVGEDLKFRWIRGDFLAELGIAPEIIEGVSLAQALTARTECEPAYVRLAKRSHRAALRGETAHYELRWFDRDWHAVTRPLINVAGEPVAVLGFSTDVTETQGLRTELELSRRQLQALFDHAVDAMLLVDDGGQIVAANPAAQSLIGYPAQRLVEEAIACLTTGSDPTPLGREELAASPPPQRTLTRADGHQIVIQSDAVTDIVPGLHLLILRDVTSQVRAAAALQQALDEERRAASLLREADDMKAAFLQAVSHELRTPLTSVLGFARTLQGHRHALTDEVTDSLIERLVHNSERLERLVADLLDIDRTTRGLLVPNRKPTDVGALVARTLEQLDSGDHPVHVHGPTEPVIAELDGPRTERILENLVANAIKHTPANAAILVRYHLVGDVIHLHVDDQGDGIPDTLKPVVFDAFTQGDTPAALVGGAGIGLALVDRFASMQGGRVTVDNGLAGGTRITVELPVRPAVVSDDSAA